MLNGFLSPALNQRDKIIGVFDADSKAQPSLSFALKFPPYFSKSLKLLEKYGGNFKAKDRDGCSMVNYAASSHSLEIVKYLVERGADPKARCSHNQSVTPSDWARKNEDKRVYEYLKSLEAE